MKFLGAFVGVLIVALLLIRLIPEAPSHPAGPMHHMHHDAQAPATDATEEEEEHEHEGASTVPAAAPGQTYGAAVTPDGAVPMSGLAAVLGSKDSVQVKLVGEAAEVCQAKGCWMTLPTADGKQMRVRFKDYAFFVPKDLGGHTVVVSGWAHREKTSVADQQHYLRDAGKSEQEIAAITEPKEELNFLADGVLVQK